MPRVKVREGEPPMFPRWAALRVVLKDGTVLEKRIDKLRGSTELPLSDIALVEKGRDCCLYGDLPVEAARLAEACFRLPQQKLSSVLAVLPTQN